MVPKGGGKCEEGTVSRGVGRKGREFPVCELVEDEPVGPALAGELVRGVDPNRPDPVDQLRNPEANRKQKGKPHVLGVM